MRKWMYLKLEEKKILRHGAVLSGDANKSIRRLCSSLVSELELETWLLSVSILLC